MLLIDNYYILFGSREPLNLRELKRRYYNLSKVYHPDIKIDKKENVTGEMFMQLSSAYKLLVDKDFKRVYDRILLEQNKNIEVLAIDKSSYIDYIDCEFISVKDKLKLAELELLHRFKISTYKLLVKHFFKISPRYSLTLIKVITKKEKLSFEYFYFELLFEVLLNEEGYFKKYLSFFKELEFDNLNDKNLISMCFDVVNKDFSEVKFKKLLLAENSKLLHLLAIKMMD